MKKGFLLLEFCCALLVLTTLLYIVVHYHGTILILQQKIAHNNNLADQLHNAAHEPKINEKRQNIVIHYSWGEHLISIKHII